MTVYFNCKYFPSYTRELLECLLGIRNPCGGNQFSSSLRGEWGLSGGESWSSITLWHEWMRIHTKIKLRVVRKTQGTLQENKSDSHLKLRGSYSIIKTKSHKNENWRKSYSAADYQLKGSRSLRDHSPQSLTNDEGEGNENGKKPIGLDWQNIYNGHFSLQRESA